MSVTRQPEGIPIGGQFAATPHAEPPLSLPSADPFAYLSGIEKAKAQLGYAAELKREATATYVQDLSQRLLAINPDFGRLYVKRNSNMEEGLTFDLDRVEDIHGNVGDVDLSEFEEHSFQDIGLDGYVDYDETSRDLYINIEPGD